MKCPKCKHPIEHQFAARALGVEPPELIGGSLRWGPPKKNPDDDKEESRRGIVCQGVTAEGVEFYHIKVKPRTQTHHRLAFII